MASTAHESHPVTNPTPSSNLTSATPGASFLQDSSALGVPLASNSTQKSSLPTSAPAKNLKQALPANLQGPILTGAAALAEEQQAQETSAAASRSSNPAAAVVKTLMADRDQSMSQPSDTPVQPTTRITDTDGRSMAITDEPMQIDQGQVNVSESSENVHDPRLTQEDANGTAALSTPEQSHEERSNKAYTYPPRPDQIEARDTPTRGMSLPTSSSKSPGSKKHRCNHCGTEFTRHHNLKSHLLTHSQEKPFCCDRCDQKFRRLHDLKRHTKLHTGERPHTCHKCGRAFARGDALARHNKGPGGCAGRRGSGGDDDLADDLNGDESMEGVIYDQNGEMQNSKRRKSEQTHNRKRSFQSTMDTSPYRQHSSTYPGVAPMLGTQAHAQPNGPPQPHHLSPRMSSASSQFPQLGPPQSVFGQGGMTESPKPLSPGAEQSRRLSAGLPYPARGRSPSLAHQHQLSRSTGQNSPSTTGIPGAPSQPVLPSLGSIASESKNSSLPSSASGASGPQLGRPPPSISTSHIMAAPGLNSAGSTNPPSASSQHRSSGGSMREILNPNPVDGPPQEFIRKSDHDLQLRRVQEETNARIQNLENLIRVLKEENSALRGNQERQQPAIQSDAVPPGH